MQSYGTNEPRGLMGGGGVLSSPLPTMSVPDIVGQGRYVNPWPIHPHTHPSHPTTHPCTPPTSHSPSHPLVPITPVLFLLLSTHPSTHPLTQPLTHPPTHPCALTTPPILNISISCE